MPLRMACCRPTPEATVGMWRLCRAMRPSVNWWKARAAVFQEHEKVPGGDGFGNEKNRFVPSYARSDPRGVCIVPPRAEGGQAAGGKGAVEDPGRATCYSRSCRSAYVRNARPQYFHSQADYKVSDGDWLCLGKKS